MAKKMSMKMMTVKKLPKSPKVGMMYKFRTKKGGWKCAKAMKPSGFGMYRFCKVPKE